MANRVDGARSWLDPYTWNCGFGPPNFPRDIFTPVTVAQRARGLISEGNLLDFWWTQFPEVYNTLNVKKCIRPIIINYIIK